MTKRHLWTIVGGCLCFAAGLSGCRADAPDDWVCNTVTKKGTCDKEIVVQGSRPKGDDEVRHLVKQAKFRINYDGSTYKAQLTSKEWLPGFKDVTFEWKEVLDADNKQKLITEAQCKAFENAAGFATLFARRVFAAPDYSRFVTKDAVPIHVTDDGQDIQKHDWLIYPIGDTATADKHSYCLMIPSTEASGGSHDGAVHGEG
jgi:hypothetical protein